MLDHSLQIDLYPGTSQVSKFATLPPTTPFPILLDHSLQLHLQTRSIRAFKYISELAQFRHPSQFPNLLKKGLGAHLKVHPITVWWNGGSRSQTALFNTPPHLAWSHKGMYQKVDFKVKQRKTRVGGNASIPGQHESHTFCGSLYTWQECVIINKFYGCTGARQNFMGQAAGKPRLYITCNARMSIYPGVSQIYITCRWVYLCYPCISIWIYVDRHKQYMPYYDVVKFVSVTMTNMINGLASCYGTLRTTGARIWHQVSSRACAAAFELSHSPALGSQKLKLWLPW